MLRVQAAAHGGDSSRPPPPPLPPVASFAASLADAVEGALLGALLGDALAAPLHWHYSRAGLVAARASHGPRGLEGFAAVPPAARRRHPDSGKYFARAAPLLHPVRALFNGREAEWTLEGDAAAAVGGAGVGPAYHAPLAAGESTLAGTLLLAAARSVVDARGVDAARWFDDYARVVVNASPGARHKDLWVDETHRVLWANIASGADPAAAGMDDACLSGLGLALPALLAYAGCRDTRLVAARTLLQFTHKSPDLDEPLAVLGELLSELLAAGAARGAGAAPPPGADAGAGLHSLLAAAYSRLSPPTSASLDLDEVLSRGLSDDEAYHGPTVVFSAR